MAINEKEGDICLLLEDLDSTSKYNVDLLSFEQYKFAVKKIAEFHAMWRKKPKPKWARPARAPRRPLPMRPRRRDVVVGLRKV